MNLLSHLVRGFLLGLLLSRTFTTKRIHIRLNLAAHVWQTLATGGTGKIGKLGLVRLELRLFFYRVRERKAIEAQRGWGW